MCRTEEKLQYRGLRLHRLVIAGGTRRRCLVERHPYRVGRAVGVVRSPGMVVSWGSSLCAVCGHAADQRAQAPAASPPPQAAPPSSDAIPVAEIAAQAATTTAFLRGLTSRLAPSAEIERIQRALPEASKLIELESEATAHMLRGQPSLAAIASQQELWEARQLQTDRWLSALTRRTSDLQAEMGRLTELQARWGRAQASAQASQAPVPVLQQVADLLAGIAAAQAATSSAAHRGARPSEPSCPGGCSVQRRPGADRARPGAGDGGDPGTGQPSDLERRGMGGGALRRPRARAGCPGEPLGGAGSVRSRSLSGVATTPGKLSRVGGRLPRGAASGSRSGPRRGRRCRPPRRRSGIPIPRH